MMIATSAKVSLLVSGLLLYTIQSHANEATIVTAKIQAVEEGTRNFRIDVTLQHNDTGWDHYANRWDVLDQNGNLLGTRTLYHPHVDEQPFTRSLSLTIPPEVTHITIVASDSVHGDNSETLELEVPD